MNYSQAHIIISILLSPMIGSYEVTAFSLSLVEEFNNKALKIEIFFLTTDW